MKSTIFFLALSMTLLGCITISTVSYGWSGDPWGSISRVTITSIASDMIDFSWSPQNDIQNYRSPAVQWTWFYAGTTYWGEAYTQDDSQENKSEFLDLVNNTSGGQTGYGNDCSGFASIAWKLPTRYTTVSFESDATAAGGYCTSLGAVGSGAGVTLYQGDALNDSGSHIILVNRYVTGGVESMEQTPTTARRQTWSWSSLSTYRPIRRNDLVDCLSGDVSGHWTTANSPYSFCGDVTVPPGSSLQIDPGVMINYNGYSFTVNGQFLWGQ